MINKEQLDQPQGEETKGFFYVATGELFLKETVKSAKSLKLHMPDAQITLYTDKKSDVTTDIFDDIIELEEVVYSFRDKVLPIMEPPYDKAVFLDTDTFIMQPLDELFDLLDHFDFAAVHAPNRAWKGYDYQVPQCFPELNSGVLVYRKCPAVTAMMDEWFDLYEAQLKQHGIKSPDQPPLRAALYRSDVKSTILPPEYNFRVIFPNAAGAMPVKILHGRGAPLLVAKLTVNKKLKARSLNPYRNAFFLRIIYKLLGYKNI